MSTPIASTVLKAFDVLQVLSQHGSMTVHECAELVGIPPSTAYRLLTTLRQVGAVEASRGGHFRVGSWMIEMALNAPLHRGLADRSRQALRELAEATVTDVRLEVLSGCNVAALCTVRRCPAGAETQGHAVQPRPVLSTASGRLLLAYVADDQVTDVVARASDPASRTEDLDAELASIVRRGYAEFRGDDAYGLAVGLRTPGLTGVAAVSVETGLSVDTGRFRQLYTHLLRVVARIERGGTRLALASGS